MPVGFRNRELLAGITFEPGTISSDDDVSSDASSPWDSKTDEDVQEKEESVVKPERTSSSEDSMKQNQATMNVIKCLKIALTKSITSISHPEKQRPLNPKTDFSIETTVEYHASSLDGRGPGCCGPSAVKERRKHTDRNFAYLMFDEVTPTEQSLSDGEVARAALFRQETGPTTELGADGRRRTSAKPAFKVDNMAFDNDADFDYENEGEMPPVDFKFTDYSPMCYRHIREFLEVDPTAYCDVLHYSRWHSIPTPGKSAAQLFFCGRDWVIKTMNKEESEFLREILHRYYYHIRDNPFTLLPHFVGHHRLEIGSDTYNFIIMQNVFATTNTIHEKFDLKGSVIGRYASEAEKVRATCTQKDLDLHSPLHIGQARRALLIEQIKKDCSFLKRCEIMDYSFLVGVHYLSPSTSKLTAGGGVQAGSVQQTMPVNSGSFSNAATATGRARPGAGLPLAATRTSFGYGSPVQHGLDGDGGVTADSYSDNWGVSGAASGGMGTAAATGVAGQTGIAPMTQRPTAVRHDALDGGCFTATEGGMLCNDVPGLRKELYYIGIIDVLQKYNARKTVEHMFFGAIHDRKRISCVSPENYADRFLAFMSAIIV